MSSDNDLRSQLTGIHDDLQVAHDHASNHRAEIAASTVCGCFYCCERFPPGDIIEWTDEKGGVGQTAICPKCGIDSVIGDSSGFPLSDDFLASMQAHWF